MRILIHTKKITKQDYLEFEDLIMNNTDFVDIIEIIGDPSFLIDD